MKQQIKCPIHGEQTSALVCTHITETIMDSKPRGFHWNRDQSGEYQAVCTACKNIPEAQWAARLPQITRAICLQCFAEAGRKNGIVWPNDNAARG